MDLGGLISFYRQLGCCPISDAAGVETGFSDFLFGLLGEEEELPQSHRDEKERELTLRARVALGLTTSNMYIN